MNNRQAYKMLILLLGFTQKANWISGYLLRRMLCIYIQIIFANNYIVRSVVVWHKLALLLTWNPTTWAWVLIRGVLLTQTFYKSFVILFIPLYVINICYHPFLFISARIFTQTANVFGFLAAYGDLLSCVDCMATSRLLEIFTNTFLFAHLSELFCYYHVRPYVRQLTIGFWCASRARIVIRIVHISVVSDWCDIRFRSL